MESFSEYILNENDLVSKIEITYYLAKKKRIFFDKSVVFKTEIARNFLNYAKLDLSPNLILTACLLCNCKKIDNAQDIESLHNYAKNGANYLSKLGFNNRFCKICEEVNRYSGSKPREREGDILELVDHFGGMLLDRPERIGLKPDEALVLLEHRNMKENDNIYLQEFKDFISFMEEINIREFTNMTALNRLVKIYNETKSLSSFIQKIVNEYQPKIDRLLEKQLEMKTKEMFDKVGNPNRPLFSEETTKKIMSQINTEKLAKVEE
jgi:hypothetical protein